MKTFLAFIILCSTAQAQTFQFYDRGPGMDVIMDTRGNYRYLIPLGPGRNHSGYYVFDDDSPRPPEVWLNLNPKPQDEYLKEDEDE